MTKLSVKHIPQIGDSPVSGRDETAELVAEAFGCTASYVRKLLRGERAPKTEAAKIKAAAIIKAYFEYQTGKARLKNNLIKAVEKLIA